MPRRVMSRGASLVMSFPLKWMLPLSGLRYPVIMLMKVVLPAPLVPMRPTTESASMAAFTALAAVTAPKRFSRFFASSITAISGRLRRGGGHLRRGAPAEQRPQAFGQEYDHEQQ